MKLGDVASLLQIPFTLWLGSLKTEQLFVNLIRCNMFTRRFNLPSDGAFNMSSNATCGGVSQAYYFSGIGWSFWVY